MQENNKDESKVSDVEEQDNEQTLQKNETNAEAESPRSHAEDETAILSSGSPSEESESIQEGIVPQPSPLGASSENLGQEESLFDPHHQASSDEQPLNETETQENFMQENSQSSAMEDNFEEETLPLESSQNNTIQRDTIFGEEDNDKAVLAEINFDLVDAGRWLLKVIAGPNNGAEFSMHSASSYVIGTDPTSCDIVFHDNSVSRQHARVTLASDDGMSIEDLKSRNQTLVDGEAIKTKTKLLPNAVVTIGTTSFTIYDREGEMQTIISPLMPAIVKVLQKEEPKIATTPASPSISSEQAPVMPAVEEPPAVSLAPVKQPEKAAHALGAFIVLGIISGLFVILGLGTAALFKSEPVVVQQEVNTGSLLSDTLKPFPNITPYYNKSTGTLQLMGHVSTQADKQRLFYSLQGLPFVRNIDDAGVIIDEYVWQEINTILSKNPNWKGIYVQSPAPGKFILSGYLQTRNQADQLAEYITNNFIYLDLLERNIVVEEDVVNKANNILSSAGFRDINIKMENGELILTGGFPTDKEELLQNTVEEMSKIPGIRDIKNLTSKLAPDQSIINISDRYEVNGFSRRGATYSIVIHGRILTTGDEIDGMQITEIKPNSVMLEKDNVKYRIDFSR